MGKIVKSALLFLVAITLTVASHKMLEARDSTFSLIPMEYNAEEGVLSGEIFVDLGWKHRGADAVSVDAVDFVMNETPLRNVEGNTYTAPVTLRFGEAGLYRIHILRGQEVVDVVYEGHGIYGLLPIQRGSWGGELPEYDAGVLNLHDNMQIATTDEDGVFYSVKEPHFHIYKNNILIESWEAAERKDTYRISAESEILLDCESGDEVQVTFTCMDVYGLSYEFTLYDYFVEGNELKENSFDTNPVLTWN